MVLAVSTVNAEKYFVLNVNHIIDSVTFNSINLEEIDRTIKYSDKSGFLIKAVSFEKKDIRKFYYNISGNRNYIIYIPYNKNAARIEMYNPNNSKIMEIDTTSFADTCGNKVCEPYESYESCPRDCKSGSRDDFCDGIKDGTCDPDCSPNTDIDCKSRQSNSTFQTTTKINEQQQEQIKLEEETEEQSASKLYTNLRWIWIALGVTFFILFFVLIIKIRENKTINSLKQYINENLRKGFTIQQIKDVLLREGYKEKEVERAFRSI